MKPYMKSFFATLLLIPIFTGLAEDKKDLPNFVIFNLDDSGYSDFSPFGNTAYPTPHVKNWLMKAAASLTSTLRRPSVLLPEQLS